MYHMYKINGSLLDIQYTTDNCKDIELCLYMGIRGGCVAQEILYLLPSCDTALPLCAVGHHKSTRMCTKPIVT